MNVKMFGHRCLVEHYRPKSSASAIIIPDGAGEHDTHRLGRVVVVGEGKDKDGKPMRPLVSAGDLVMFQLNQVMEATQKFVLGGHHYMNLLQSEIVGRVEGDEPSVDNFKLVGDYVLLQPFFRQPEGSKIILPEAAMRQSAAEFVYFKVAGMDPGKTDANISIGDEVICNFGRLTPIFFVKRGLDRIAQNQEFCYTTHAWIDGVVLNEAGS